MRSNEGNAEKNANVLGRTGVTANCAGLGRICGWPEKGGSSDPPVTET